MKIAFLQIPLEWESPQANKDFIAAQLQSQDLSDTDLVVLPETFNTGFSMKAIHLAEPMHGETVQWMTELSNQYDILLAGSIMIREGNNVFNRFIVAGPDTVVASYDKKHLFGLGAEQDLINPGTERVCFTHKGLMINLQICYDLRFPVWMRNTENVDLILLVANWPAARAKAWRSLLVARAIENQCYILGVNRIGLDGNQLNYSGDSLLVDYTGEIRIDAKDELGVFFGSLKKNELTEFRQRFPFYKDADPFSLK